MWLSARNCSGCPPGITLSTPDPRADPAHPHLFPVSPWQRLFKDCTSPGSASCRPLQTGSILRPSHGIWKGKEGRGRGVLLLWLVFWQAGPCRCEFFPAAGSGTQLPPQSQRPVGSCDDTVSSGTQPDGWSLDLSSAPGSFGYSAASLPPSLPCSDGAEDPLGLSPASASSPTPISNHFLFRIPAMAAGS